ncbi:hypothetical protein SeLEV6574_g06457 [Synchytrium endobioticum]|uniref:DUF3752 domain-containing protein n=1 Tax=Synchytrium endobioticum TaxID=286115 RepID=A0A507CNL0_9FUNG|nr:hypothetical protein SeLEV6574_g06457 [Synchytrium endobioticum]
MSFKRLNPKAIRSYRCDKDRAGMSEVQYGPALPPGLKRKKDQQQEEGPIESRRSQPKRRTMTPMGPSLPSTIRNGVKEDDEAVGPRPLPADGVRSEQDELEEKIAEIEARARRDLNTESKLEAKLEREDWMTKPPVAKAGRGGSTVDTTAWTASPLDKDKGKHSQAKKPPMEYITSDQDQATKEFVKMYNEKNRAQSLLESHQIDISTDVEDVSKRPFDREKDMAMRRFDGNSRQRLIDQSQGLGSRFGHGKKTFL